MSIEDKALELVGQALSLLSQKENNVSDAPAVSSDLIEKVKMYKRASVMDSMAEVLSSAGNEGCSSALRSLSDRIKTAAKKQLEDKKKEPTMKQKNENKLRDISAALDSRGHFKFASLILDMADRLKDESCGNCSDCSCDIDPVVPQADPVVDTMSLPTPPMGTLEIPENTIKVVKESEAPDLLKKLLTTMRATSDLVGLYKSSLNLQNPGISSSLQGVVQRTAASSLASQPIVLKTLQDRFNALEIKDPMESADAIRGILKELEGALYGGLKKIKDCDIGGLKTMVGKALSDIEKDPSKSKAGISGITNYILKFIQNVDQGIKNMFREYNLN